MRLNVNRPPTSILITGSRGMLAWDLIRVFEHAFPDARLHAMDREALDITSAASIRAAFEKTSPTWVVNAAAYTNVDGAESDREKAHAVNARGPELLAAECIARSARLIHFSTDQVFDGSVDRPRTEEEPTAPSNYYAATKLEGEKHVLAAESSLVLRVQWLYGERKDRFSPLRQKTLFTPFADQYGCPTWTKKLAEITAILLQMDARGLFHIAYDDYASWAEVFEFVKQEWNLPLQLKPQLTADLRLPANRPLFSVLSNRKLKEFLGVAVLGSWKAPLREFLALKSV